MNQKYITAILTCLLMLTAYIASGVVTVNAPEPEPIKMYAVATDNPGWGYYGGYHDIWALIKPELLKIGIDLQIDYMEAGIWWDLVWDENWNTPGDPDGDGVRDGWDMSMNEWWLNPTSFIWLDELLLRELVPYWNIMPWMNQVQEGLYRDAVAELDPDTHNELMFYWQKEFMHDPPVIPLWYHDIRTGQAKYVDSYDGTSWFYEMRHMDVNEAEFATATATVPIRAGIGSDTLMYAAVEPIWAWNPFRTLTYTEEMMNVMTKGMLYAQSREIMNPNPPTAGDWYVYPQLASDYPSYLPPATAEALYGLNPDTGEPYSVARIPLRTGVKWSDGVTFNATDVAFTWNSMLEKQAGSYARGDYIHVYKSVEIVSEYVVDFLLYNPRYDLAGYFAHGWGIAPVPYHQMKDVPLSGWKTHDTNWDPVPVSQGGLGLECLGPYVPTSWVPDVSVTCERFDVATGESWYWDGLDLPSPYSGKWGHGLPSTFITKIIEDDGTRKSALETLEVDFVEYPTASLAEWALMDPVKFDVFDEPYPASHPVWFNLNNEILSNRYVRLAIAHAIPYPAIAAYLPTYGVSQMHTGVTFITPWNEEFNATVGNYVYDIPKAQQYMDMWRYGQSNKDPATNGPEGDHDLSNYVELADFSIWANHIGTTPTNYQQYDFPYPLLDTDPHRYYPGLNVDADNDNNDIVELDDMSPIWVNHRGTTYPFIGAW